MFIRDINDDYGDNLLHALIRKSSSLTELLFFLQQLNNVYSMSNLAMRVNKEGKLPLELISSSKLKADEQSVLTNYLLKFMKNSIMPLGGLINYKIVCEKYLAPPSSSLYQLLKLACLAANLARQKIVISYTHPDLDGIPYLIYRSIKSEVIRDRQETERRYYEILYHCPESNYRLITKGLTSKIICNISDETRKLLAVNQIHLFMLNGHGNCAEMGDLVIYYLQKMLSQQGIAENIKSLPLEKIQIENGDHEIVVWGSLPKNSPYRFNPLGSNAIVIDALYGFVYPVSDLQACLKDHCIVNLKRKDGITYHHIFLSQFNTAYHVLNKSHGYPLEIALAWVPNLNSFVDKFVYRLNQQFSLKEKFLFHNYITDKLCYFLKKNIISEKDLEQLIKPKETLKYVFLSQAGFDAIKSKQLSLKQLEDLYVIPKLKRTLSPFKRTYYSTNPFTFLAPKPKRKVSKLNNENNEDHAFLRRSI